MQRFFCKDLDKSKMLCYNIITKLNGAQFDHPKNRPSCIWYIREGRFLLWNYARLTGLLLSIEPLADVIGIDACYDGEYEIEYNAQSTHPLSVMSD